MKTICLCWSLSLLLVITTNAQQSGDKFCEISGAVVNRAFIIQNDIYFGDGKEYWKMNANDFTISNKETIGKLFGQNIAFKTITSAICFSRLVCDIPAANCGHMSKAKDLVIVIGTIDSQGKVRGYKAYRASPDTDPVAEEDNTTMPWGLILEAKLTGKFWVDQVDSFESFTFDDYTKTIYMMTVTSKGKHVLYHRKILDSGLFDNTFKSVDVPRIYSGLIDWDTKIYGLSGDKFYLLSAANFAEEGEFSAKQFFNCDGNSPLKDDKTTNTTNVVVDNGSQSPSSDNSTSKRPVTETADSVTDPVTGSVTGPVTESTIANASESGSNWILWVVIIVIIVVVIVLIICCLFCCKKSGGKANPDTENLKSKPDSKIISEGGSKVGASSPKSSVKGGPKSNTGGGSKTLAQPSKSEVESVVSTRSGKV